ncbi:HAD-IA family hydrolase [Desulfogranum japonicum]|uniref:HAD-IA family hydrolase n=1 Tax=Desulfogranum japonicum TaxID=231447 RepID=UPI00041DFB79|nr:HAD-IA family hydrolase [Desulfogranum japonicum]
MIIFDFDGTIADSFSYFLTIINKLAKEFNFKQINQDEIHACRNKSAREVIRDLHVPIFKIPRILSKAQREFNGLMHKIQVIPGLKTALIELKKENIQLGIITSNSLKNVTFFLKENNLDVFDFLYTSSGLWGKARRLQKVIDKHHLKKDEVIYIGDETRDIEASRQVGVKIISVTWGYNTVQALDCFAPDYLVNTPQELVSILTSNPE